MPTRRFPRNRSPQQRLLGWDGMKSRTSQSIVYALLGLAIVVVSFNAWFALRSVQALAASQLWVSHTWRVIEALHSVSDSLKDAETTARGYLLTGDEDYLGPYSQAKKNLPGELAELQSLTTDNADQQRQLHELQALITTRMSLLQESIEDRRNGDTASVHEIVVGGTGLAAMNRGRSLIAAIRKREDQLLAERLATSRSDARRAMITIVFASAIDLLLLVLVFRQTAIERWLREVADRTADHLERLQSINEAALAQLTPGELTSELLGRVQKMISADVVLLCTRRDGLITVDAAVGIPVAQGARFSPAKGDPLEQAVEQDRAVRVTDTTAAEIGFEPLRQYAQSLLVAPLSASRSMTGVLVAGRSFRDGFDREEEELLTVASGRIALALDRAEAYEAERAARKEAEVKAEEVRVLNAELEARVSQRTSELEATNRELEAFSYSVSHDLRAPLRTIDGFSAALREDYEQALDATGQDYLRRIREGVQRMGQLIDSLLQLSRITRTGLTREAVNLSAMATAILNDLSAQNPGRGLVFHIQPDLQSMGDPRLLRAALENLLGNAVKFTAKEPEARIEIGRLEDAYFVRDNGVGFDMRYADKLFHAFHRLHGDKDFRGSGIGLATVARIISRHQGKIWAESKLGQGATFWFTLG
jgi:signal transduction histidine kinase/CHASE3 domain sensor protein